MEMYQDLIRGDDDVNKLTTLGNALIAGGSALMEGEGMAPWLVHLTNH